MLGRGRRWGLRTLLDEPACLPACALAAVARMCSSCLHVCVIAPAVEVVLAAVAAHMVQHCRCACAARSCCCQLALLLLGCCCCCFDAVDLLMASSP